MSREITIRARQRKLKEAFIEQLKRTPTVESACQKAGVGRATVYRWMKESKRFNETVETSLKEGRSFMSDVAESQLFSLIGERKIEAIRLFLAHNNPRYGNKLELTGSVGIKDEPLSASQKALIRKALKLSSLRTNEKRTPDTGKDTAR